MFLIVLGFAPVASIPSNRRCTSTRWTSSRRRCPRAGTTRRRNASAYPRSVLGLNTSPDLVLTVPADAPATKRAAAAAIVIVGARERNTSESRHGRPRQAPVPAVTD